MDNNMKNILVSLLAFSLFVTGCAGIIYAPQKVMLNAEKPNVNITTESKNIHEPTKEMFKLGGIADSNEQQ